MPSDCAKSTSAPSVGSPKMLPGVSGSSLALTHSAQPSRRSPYTSAPYFACSSAAGVSRPAAKSSPTATQVTVILLRVSVPVLSQQMTEALPSVSTAGRLLTSAFFFAMRCTPSAMMMVLVAGSPSGMMEMASEIAVMIMETHCVQSRMRLMPSTSTQTISPTRLSILPTELSLRLMGVSKSSCSSRSPAILPTSVFMPVPTT